MDLIRLSGGAAHYTLTSPGMHLYGTSSMVRWLDPNRDHRRVRLLSPNITHIGVGVYDRVAYYFTAHVLNPDGSFTPGR